MYSHLVFKLITNKMRLMLVVLISLQHCFGDERGARVRRIVGGEPAVQPPEDDPVVFTRFAGRTARVEGVRDFPHYVFRGIRYAKPPTGQNRFLRPIQYFLEDYENATKFPPPCIQPIPGQDTVIGDEDCLFLNVFTPTLPTGTEGLPVVVWIHGGGFRYGSASQYGVRHLVGKQVVVVTIQYRLGSLGFLCTGTKDLPGNAALWDMVLAVQWVRNYIGFFGGNPYRIVVMGHGTGASSAMLVALSNVAKGLTSGLVAMSGSSISHWATDDDGPNIAKMIADQNGCPTRSPVVMVRCLQKLSPQSIIREDSQIEFTLLEKRGFVSGMSGRLGTSPIREGLFDKRALPPLIEMEALMELSLPNKAKIPLLTGITRDETKRACEGQYKNEILTKLQTIPNFLDNVLVKNLQSKISTNVGNIANKSEQILSKLDPLQFGNYIKVQRNNLKEGLAKIAEATGDALFNVPAFLTAELWSKTSGPSFLYRFEHFGKRNKGSEFLRGLPLVGNLTHNTSGNDGTIGHGDELPYLFDVHDVVGNSLETNEIMDPDDAKVRDIFTQLIADFARFGTVSLGKEKIKPFSSMDNNFLQISPKPTIANNFRYCQMALWCGLAERLKSSVCSVFQVLDSQLKNVQNLFDVKKVTNTDPLGLLGQNKDNNISSGLHLGGILSGGGNKNNNTDTNNKLNPLDLFGGKSTNKQSSRNRPGLGILG